MRIIEDARLPKGSAGGAKGDGAKGGGTTAGGATGGTATASVLASLLVLAACEDGAPLDSAADGSDTATPLPMPAQLQTRALDRDAVFPIVRVGDGIVPPRLDTVERAWSVPLSLPPGEAVRVDVSWYESFEGGALLLAGWNGDVGPATGDGEVIVVDATDYDSTRPEFDADSDGLSNLAEREMDTDPLDRDDPGAAGGGTTAGTPDASSVIEIPRLDESFGVPVLDGLYDDIWVQAAGARDNALLIDNLVLDFGTGTGGLDPDQAVAYRWYAMHDAESLYLFVTFEGPGEHTPQRDSGGQPFEDDRLNLFFDPGDTNGARTDIEGGDRYLFISEVPLPGQTRPTARFVADFSDGSTVEATNDIDFEVCVCSPDGTTAWEVRIPLDEISLVPGQPFGFDLQIDQDLDGGMREGRWAWAHPGFGDGREEAEANGLEVTAPDLFGTAVLLE